MTPALRDCPTRLFSLWELMNHFDAKFIAKRIGDLARIRCEFASANVAARGTDMPLSLANLRKTLDRTIPEIKRLGMGRVVRSLEDTLKEVTTQDLTAPALAVHARTAEKAVTDELDGRKFLYVEPRFTAYVDQERLFGDEVYDNFKSARGDIREAGNCLAAGCGTGAVFHLMRASEVGMRVLAKDRRTQGYIDGKLDSQQWGLVIGDLEKKIGGMDKLSAALWPSDAVRQSQIRFYHVALMSVRGFNSAFRRHVSHAHDGAFYNDEEAAAVLSYVEPFMRELATRLDEQSMGPEYWTA